MAWSLRPRFALFVATALLVACTCRESAPEADVAPSATAAPAPVEAPAPDRLPGSQAIRSDDPRVRLALQTADDLFFGRADAVNARFEPGLRRQLTADALRGVVADVVTSHGEPAQVMDAWASDIKEDGLMWHASSVLLRMSRSPVRFRLLLVFNPDDTLRGLWLRPI